ncbi:phosphatase PAP2 family protein [Allofustis seminis]|uniref:phosphatase PAP2 family protein n=1 Tax=Allofustis seminis TaxID=166939 RepID=UPI00037F87C0|nr:phosphatase PAP2 family protein [Allofustis seminis]
MYRTYLSKKNHSAHYFYGAAVIVCLPFLLLLWGTVCHQAALTAMDYQWGHYIYQLRSPQWTPFVIGVTTIGNVWPQTILTAIFAVGLWWMNERYYAQYLAWAMFLGALLLNGGIKQLVARIRPTEVTHLIDQGGYSFPSGHAMGMTILCSMLLFIIFQKVQTITAKMIWTVILVGLTLAIACSRIYLGVHFVSDVIAGISLGLSFSLLFMGSSKKRHKYRINSPY